MTVTDTRWWAPSDPGLGPDAFDLELLTPGDDPAADLGQAFLALHRVGAAACEVVAGQPIPDETTLAYALATARAEVAPEASTIIAKSVGEDTNYGNLLIRDVLDDAESSALSLWRSCIAHKVPATVTAQRVGLVYGLPPSEILDYQRIATDPRAQPAALTESADRALFGYVAKLAQAEAVDRKVEISKMTLEEWNRTEAGSKHPKDRRGRFAQVAEGSHRPQIAGQSVQDWLAAQMAGAGEAHVTELPDTAPPKTATPKRGRRGERGRRGARPAHPTVQAARTKANRLSANKFGAAKTEATRVDALLQRTHDDEKIARTTNLSRTVRDPGDVTQGYERTEGDDELYAHYIPNQLGFVLPSDEFSAFYQAAQPGEFGRLFRAGRLQDYAGAPEVYLDDDEQEGEEHQRNVAHVADLLYPDKSAQRPIVSQTMIPAIELDASDDGEGDLIAAKMRFLTEEIRLSQEQASREITHVYEGANYDDPEQVSLVYMPPPMNAAASAARKPPAVTEIVITDDDLYGFNDAPPGSPPQWRMEKNQTLSFVNVLAGRYGRKRFWDDNLGVFRTRFFVRPTDEEPGETSKAMDHERFVELEEAGRVRRNDQGEFTRASIAHVMRQLEESQGMTAVPTRATRGKRGKRGTRGARPVAVPTGVQAAKTTANRVQAQRQLATKVHADAVDEHSEALKLPQGEYTAIPPDIDLGFSFSHRKLGKHVRSKLARYDPNSVHGVELDTEHIHQDAHTLSDRVDNEVKIFKLKNVTVEGLEDVAGALHHEMDKDLHFTLARVNLKLNGDDTANITIWRNQRPLGIRDVIRWNGVDPREGDFQISPAEQGRFQDLKTIRAWLHGAWESADKADTSEDDDFLTNPWVRVWDAER